MNIKKAMFYFSTSPENKELDQLRDGIHIADIISWFNIVGKTSINRLDIPYFVYDFYLWGAKGKIEIFNNGEILNFYKIKKSSRFEGFKELKLIYIKKISESTLSNAYSEFVEFLNGKSTLTTDINDAVNALEIFERHVYNKKIFR